MTVRLTKTREGFCLLNVGCGTHIHPEWNNVDWFPHRGVLCWNLKRPFPYPPACIDAAYGSHVLEHFPPEEGRVLLVNLKRILKPGGIIRLVVPDLEQICRDYVTHLEAVSQQPSSDAMMRYRWSVLELLDQLVRQEPGGLMVETIQQGAVDPEYLKRRCGDEFERLLPGGTGSGSPSRVGRRAFRERLAGTTPRALMRAITRRCLGWILDPDDPRRSGELHRWMYDRLSLRLLLEEVGYEDVGGKAYHESAIPSWARYPLDTAASGNGPRKPNSLFVEARTPLPR